MGLPPFACFRGLSATCGGGGGARRRQGTVVVAAAVEPSWNVKFAENGKPPAGHDTGTEIPMGWKATRGPWTYL